MKCYAGIGTREPPIDIFAEFKVIAEELALKGYTLRSGGADGCDSAFELGAAGKEIFLPWKGFNGNKSQHYLTKAIPQNLVDIASRIYPRWNSVSDAVRQLHARNVQQVLGEHADDPSDFVVCCTDRPYNVPEAIGGTMFAIVLAEEYKIPVFNFFILGDEERFIEFFRKIS